MLRVAVIGCGDMGGLHASAWDARSDAQVVAVCDANRERRADFGSKYQATEYSNWANAIAHGGVDVVSVCTPANLHHNIAVAAAKAGRHILCEKPMALTMAQADAMVSIANVNNVRLSVCHQYRGLSRYKIVRQLVEEGTLGSPLFMRFMDTREVRPKLSMHELSVGGGPVHDMTGHLFDLALLLTNSAAKSVTATGAVFGAGKNRLAGINMLGTDTAEIQMRFEGGHCLSIGVCWGLPEGTPEHWHEVCHGPLGLVYPEKVGGGVFDPADKSGTTRLVINDALGERKIDCQVDPEGPEICIDDLAAAIKVGASGEFDGLAGREVLRLVLATLESVRTGQTVLLDG